MPGDRGVAQVVAYCLFAVDVAQLQVVEEVARRSI